MAFPTDTIPKFEDSITDTVKKILAVLGNGITIDPGDVEIGAVEIKDGTTDTRAVVGANGLNVDVKAISGAPNGNLNLQTANVGGTTTLAARTGRRGVVVRCPVASAEGIYWGFTTGVTAVNGSLLSPGQNVPLDYAGALFFFSAGGTGKVENIELY